MIKSMTRDVASITLKEQVVALTFQSHKHQNFGSTLHTDGVIQTAYLPNLKLKYLTIFNVRKTLSYALDEFQPYNNPIFQLFGADNDTYDGSDSSPTSTRDSHFS